MQRAFRRSPNRRRSGGKDRDPERPIEDGSFNFTPEAQQQYEETLTRTRTRNRIHAQHENLNVHTNTNNVNVNTNVNVNAADNSHSNSFFRSSALARTSKVTVKGRDKDKDKKSKSKSSKSKRRTRRGKSSRASSGGLHAQDGERARDSENGSDGDNDTNDNFTSFAHMRYAFSSEHDDNNDNDNDNKNNNNAYPTKEGMFRRRSKKSHRASKSVSVSASASASMDGGLSLASSADLDSDSYGTDGDLYAYTDEDATDNDNDTDGNYTDGNDTGNDTDNGSLKSKSSLGSLKISRMNHSKRREFIKSHLRAEREKEKKLERELVAKEMELRKQKHNQTQNQKHNQQQNVSLNTPPAATILPSKLDRIGMGMDMGMGMGSSETDAGFQFPTTGDPWAPNMSLNENDEHDKDDGFGFEFPSDPFAAFDADMNMDLDGNNNSNTIGRRDGGTRSAFVDVQVEKVEKFDTHSPRGRQRSNSQSSLNKRIFGFSPLRNGSANANVNFDSAGNFDTSARTRTQNNRNSNANVNSKKSTNTSTSTRLVIDGRSVKDSRMDTNQGGDMGVEIELQTQIKEQKPLMRLPSRKGAGVSSAGAGVGGVVKGAPSNSSFQSISQGANSKSNSIVHTKMNMNKNNNKNGSGTSIPAPVPVINSVPPPPLDDMTVSGESSEVAVASSPGTATYDNSTIGTSRVESIAQRWKLRSPLALRKSFSKGEGEGNKGTNLNANANATATTNANKGQAVNDNSAPIPGTPSPKKPSFLDRKSPLMNRPVRNIHVPFSIPTTHSNASIDDNAQDHLPTSPTDEREVDLDLNNTVNATATSTDKRKLMDSNKSLAKGTPGSKGSVLGTDAEARNLPLDHIGDFLKFSEDERLEAYCDLFGMAAETLKDVDAKRETIDQMGKQVDVLIGRVSEMEHDKDGWKLNVASKEKELKRLKTLMKLQAQGSVSSSGVQDSEAMDMLKTELESKDVIIDALQRSLEEIRKQEKDFDRQRYGEVRLSTSVSSPTLGAGTSTYSEEQVQKIRLEHQEELKKIQVETEGKMKDQSTLIHEQKIMIREARGDIQERNRTIDDLRTDITSRDATISKLKTKGTRSIDEGVQAELEKTKEMLKNQRSEHDREIKKLMNEKEELARRNVEVERTANGTDSISEAHHTTSDSVDMMDESSDIAPKASNPSTASATNRTIDINIPVGTVRAKVALAASRAIKNTAKGAQQSYLQLKTKEHQDIPVKRSLATFNGSAIPGSVTGRWKESNVHKGVSEEEHEKVLSQLREHIIIIEQLKSDQKVEINKLIAEKTECEHYLDELKDTHKLKLGKLSGEKIELEHRLIEIEAFHKEEVDRIMEEKSELKLRLKELEGKTQGLDIETLLAEKMDLEKKAASVEANLGQRLKEIEAAHEDEMDRIMAEKADHIARLEELENKSKGLDIETLLAEKMDLEEKVITLQKHFESSRDPISFTKVSKDDENKFAEVEAGYTAEIEGLIAEKKELEHRMEMLESCHDDEIKILQAEQSDYKRQLEDLDKAHKDELVGMAATKRSYERHISDLEQELSDLNEEVNNAKAQTQISQVGEATCEAEEEAGANGKSTVEEFEFIRKHNRQLRSKLDLLENELDTVGGLLEETIMSIKEKDDEIEALRDNPNGSRGVMGMLGGAAPKPILNSSQYTDEEIKQLERICKLHQLTITRQRSQGKEMFRQLKETKVLLKQYQTEAKENEEKAKVLENQFVELNKMMEENPSQNPIMSTESGDAKLGSSIIKIDAAYVSSLKEKTVELQNQIKILRQRNEKMKNKSDIALVLREQVDELSLSLEAKTMECRNLEEAYESNRTAGKSSSSANGNGSGFSYDDDLTAEELREIVSKKDFMIKKLRNKISTLEESMKTAGPRGAIINLRKVTVLQEMQDAILRRLNILINRMEDDRETDLELENEFMSPSRSFLISMSDKLSLLHDYQKISLHLLESKLSNEIESLKSGGKPVEMDKEIEARFERTLETIKKSEIDVESQLEQFSAELEHHNIKLSAKNGVIVTLLTKDRERQRTIESFGSDLKVYKGLDQFKNINEGIMIRFKECAKLEKELEDKDMIIQRLNNVIEEYRYEHQ